MTAAEELQRYRLSVSEIVRMLEVGVLEGEPVELLDGELIRMNAQGARHTKLTVKLRRSLERAYGEGCYVQDHSPLLLSEYDLPEPDIALIRGDPDDFEVYATGEQAVLVVEIAVSSIPRDRRKTELYAAGGVPFYWIVDVPRRRLIVHERPDRAAREYAETRVLGPEDAVRLPELSVEMAVADIIPQ